MFIFYFCVIQTVIWKIIYRVYVGLVNTDVTRQQLIVPKKRNSCLKMLIIILKLAPYLYQLFMPHSRLIAVIWLRLLSNAMHKKKKQSTCTHRKAAH